MRAGWTSGGMELQKKEEREKIRSREIDRERGFDQEKGRGDEQVDYPPVGKKESEEKEEGKEMKKNENFKIKDWVEDIADKKRGVRSREKVPDVEETPIRCDEDTIVRFF